MSEFLLVESGAPGASPMPASAVALAQAGHRVVLLLIQDGVFAATGSGHELTEPFAAGCDVWADSFSADQRALQAGDLLPAVKAVTISELADALLDTRIRVVWR